jgi:outer membrane protein insertion porin family
LEATVGGSSDQVVLSYTEPYIFDTHLTGGFDIFYRTVDYDEYSKEGKGFYLRAGYLLSDFLRVTGRYRYEWVNIFDINDNAAEEIKDIEGKSTTSSVLGMISHDNRNKYFNPTEGSENWFSAESAGNILGGSNSFLKLQAETSWYFPNTLFDESAFHVRGKAGYVVKQPGGELPTYEKFYLGGLDSVRGFSYADISPVDSETGDAVGGEKMALFNLEFTFPILKNAGIIGIVFLDHGNVWRKSQHYDLSDLKRSYGAGIRWNSPMGPLRLEYGKVINPDDDDPDGQWEFSVGGTF